MGRGPRQVCAILNNCGEPSGASYDTPQKIGPETMHQENRNGYGGAHKNFSQNCPLVNTYVPELWWPWSVALVLKIRLSAAMLDKCNLNLLVCHEAGFD